eukprot:scaffold33631_cov45-Isochrysis_galbana.AAC.1
MGLHLALEPRPRDAQPQAARRRQPEDAAGRPTERPELCGLGSDQPDAGGGQEGERVGVKNGCPGRFDAEARDEVLAVGELEDEQEEPDEDPGVGAQAVDLDGEWRWAGDA